MNLDLNTIPTTLDIVHVGLSSVVVILLLVVILRPGKSSGDKQAGTSDSNAPLDNTVEKIEPGIEIPTTAEKNSVKVIRETGPESAYQVLSILQSDARFLDFISEDLTGYSDQEIGGAARVVQEGAKKAISQYFTLTPLRGEDEETRVTVQAGFNPSEIRLTGNVVGEAPFQGVLVHKGWKVTDSKLPKLTEGHDASILAAAEIEL